MKAEEDFTQTQLDDFIKSEEEKKRLPFDFKIKQLKKYLKLGGMKQSDINKTVKLYKKKVYDKVAEVKAKMEEEFNAKNK